MTHLLRLAYEDSIQANDQMKRVPRVAWNESEPQHKNESNRRFSLGKNIDLMTKHVKRGITMEQSLKSFKKLKLKKVAREII